MNHFHLFRVIILLIATALIGCGQQNVPLSGRISYTDNDQPLERGTVAFTNGLLQARGEIKSNGEYTLGFAKESDGLPPGEYQVYITGAVELSDTPSDSTDKSQMNRPPAATLIDSRYLQASTSGLTAQVDAKTKRLDFKVDRAVPKTKR